MPSCSVYGCKTGYATQGDKGTYQSFQYPKSPALRKKWKEKVNRKAFVISTSSVVCSKHFKNEDFLYFKGQKDKGGRIRQKSKLKDSAVPSIHMRGKVFNAKAGGKVLNTYLQEPPYALNKDKSQPPHDLPALIKDNHCIKKPSLVDVQNHTQQTDVIQVTFSHKKSSVIQEQVHKVFNLAENKTFDTSMKTNQNGSFVAQIDKGGINKEELCKVFGLAGDKTFDNSMKANQNGSFGDQIEKQVITEEEVCKVFGLAGDKIFDPSMKANENGSFSNQIDKEVVSQEELRKYFGLVGDKTFYTPTKTNINGSCRNQIEYEVIPQEELITAFNLANGMTFDTPIKTNSSYENQMDQEIKKVGNKGIQVGKISSSDKNVHDQTDQNDSSGDADINNPNDDFDNATKETNPEAFAILFVHLGQESRKALSEELWDKVFVAFNLKTELAVTQGQWDPDFRIEWSNWRDSKGIVACSNEKTVNIFSNMIKEIFINGQCFQAWPEKEFEHLVTLILPRGTEIFKDPWALFMGQNCLKGKHSKPKIQNLNRGARNLQVEIDEDMAIKIRQFGGKAALGGYTVTINVTT